MNKRMTLVEKLEKELAKNCRLNNWDLGFKAAIDIVKGIMKQCDEWVSTNEQLPYAEEMLTNHYNPKEFYEIILTTGVTRWKSNTN